MRDTHSARKPLAIAVGSPRAGAGCTTTAAALATLLCTQARVVVLDQVQRPVSEWPGRFTTSAAKGFTIESPSAATVASFTSHVALTVPAGAGFDVLTDLTEPGGSTARPAAWWGHALSAGEWRVAVTDIGHPLLDHSHPWTYELSHAHNVLVLLLSATRPGVAAATHLITQWESHEANHLPVVAVAVSRAPGRWDGRVLGDLTMLEGRVAAVTHLPFDRELHRRGIAGIDRMTNRSRRALVDLAALALDVSQPAPPDTTTRTPMEVSS